ncbi:MAG TPA: AmmeMemoRadiSam system protein B [Anaeromyxobacter sp.]|nr:AmmeMemoRadiSam system protein B [Anaeromyxobacter sp.]
MTSPLNHWLRRAAVALLAAVLVPAGAHPASPAGPTAGREVREPAVAGQFYPASAEQLRSALERFLKDAAPPAAKRPIAIVVPHAGYAFSGEIAADGWRYASARPPEVVVVLGTNHTMAGFRGIAASPARGFRTPLGIAEVDRDVIEELLRADPDVVLDARPHEREHSIEVEVPFVQVLFPKAKIVPLVVGAPDPKLCQQLGQALAQVLRGKDALLVASSDLSHYPSARDAGVVDRRVLAAMASLDPDRFHSAIEAEMSRGVASLATCACGEAPILVVMSAARALGSMRGTVVRYGNSGDGPLGDRERVVGYGAVAFETGPGVADTRMLEEPAPAPAGAELDAPTRAALLAYARETLVRFLETQTVPSTRRLPPAAARSRGAFVTLTRHGELRGCIGQLSPIGPLGYTVGRMALEAALNDERFPPVTLDELPFLEIEVSVLSPMKRVELGEIVVGRDGIVLTKDGRRAVFLPQVATEQGWERNELLDHLCEKAGLPRPCWHEGAIFEAFQAEVFGEAHRP